MVKFMHTIVLLYGGILVSAKSACSEPFRSMMGSFGHEIHMLCNHEPKAGFRVHVSAVIAQAIIFHIARYLRILLCSLRSPYSHFLQVDSAIES
jgi:hypothetical protein